MSFVIPHRIEHCILVQGLSGALATRALAASSHSRHTYKLQNSQGAQGTDTTAWPSN